MKLLIIEDEKELAESVLTYLSQNDMDCEWAADCSSARQKLDSRPYDLVLLDLMLPDGNGLDLLQSLKKTHPETGVLIISAKNALDDRIAGLDLGADDYLTKPFHLPEVNARLRAIYRRRKLNGQTEIHFEEIKMDLDQHVVFVRDTPVELTTKEFNLLLFFINNQNRMITKQSIAEHLWGDNVDFLDSFDFVYQHIKNLRKKLTAAGSGDYLKTIYGHGYKFSK
ncbi:MAG: DNA-binding response regulator [Bacteroidetes bacterium]|nr:MAG: DNA-binding response regulator [Bacteroidota bacterium]